MPNYLMLWVYRSRDKGVDMDSTNEGVSAKWDVVYVQHPEGPTEERHVPEEVRFRAECRSLASESTPATPAYWALVPVKHVDGKVGPMFGGNLATSSDGRCRGVIFHIHDRWETPEEAEAYSS